MPYSPKMIENIQSKPMNTLFDLEIPVNNDPIEDLEITTFILYMSKVESRLFKKLCKIGIKKEFNEDFQIKGNVTDFLLKILKERYDSEE